MTPLQKGSLAVTDVARPAARVAATCSSTGSPSGCAAPTRRSRAASTAGRRRARAPGARARVAGPGARGAGRQRIRPGDLVVGVVRRPDPVPCGACAHGEFDMCRNGRYTERGIKEIARVRQPDLVRRDGLRGQARPRRSGRRHAVEPTTVVAKAWDQVDRVGARAWFEPRTRAGHRRGADRSARRAARRAARPRRARAGPRDRRAEARAGRATWAPRTTDPGRPGRSAKLARTSSSRRPV